MGTSDLFDVKEQREEIVNIKVVGVGGGGTNMVNYMAREGLKGVELIVSNTDAQHLNMSLAARKIQLGEKLTGGKGAGMKPEIGMKAAEESYDEIKESLMGADLVFVATGLGGGTGTGASSVVARAAKEVGALTVAVCTHPFMMEGKLRTKLAKKGYEDLLIESDSMITISNDRLLALSDKNMSYAESFAMVDAVLARAVKGICSIVLDKQMEGINTDFADLTTVMSHKGLALMNMGQASGTDAAFEALKIAIESPLLEDITIEGAMGALVHFQFSSEYPFVEINRAMGQLNDLVDEEAHIVFGTSVDNNMEPETVRVTIIATGFEKEAANNTSSEDMPKEELKIETPRVMRVSGGYDVSEDIDLEVPTFLRRGLD